jgi:hypothetical protein
MPLLEVAGEAVQHLEVEKGVDKTESSVARVQNTLLDWVCKIGPTVFRY